MIISNNKLDIIMAENHRRLVTTKQPLHINILFWKNVLKICKQKYIFIIWVRCFLIIQWKSKRVNKILSYDLMPILIDVPIQTDIIMDCILVHKYRFLDFFAKRCKNVL